MCKAQLLWVLVLVLCAKAGPVVQAGQKPARDPSNVLLVLDADKEMPESATEKFLETFEKKGDLGGFTTVIHKDPRSMGQAAVQAEAGCILHVHFADRKLEWQQSCTRRRSPARSTAQRAARGRSSS